MPQRKHITYPVFPFLHMRHKLHWVLCLCLLCAGVWAHAQRDRATSQTEGLGSNPPTAHAFVGATIVVAPGQVLENATLVVENGRIVAVGKSITPPAHAQVHDSRGKWIYPGFIDPYTQLLSKPVRGGGGRGSGSGPVYESERTGAYYWNDAVRPETDILQAPNLDEKAWEELHAQGFTLVQAAPNDGVVRGAGVVLQLGKGALHDHLLSTAVASHLSFVKGSSKMDYPGSLMGSIALMRQVLLDADWYARAQAAYQANPAQMAPEMNLSLAALSSHMKAGVPFFFECGGEVQDVLRMIRVAKEFRLPLIVKASGFEYEVLPELDPNVRYVLPLNFPEAPDVENPADAANVSLSQMRRWEQAPMNAYQLYTRNLPIAFTSHGLKKLDAFWKNLRKSIAYGLPAENALAAVTTVPAQWLGVTKEVGTLEKGKRANLVIADGDLFASEASVEQTWVGGNRMFGEEAPAEMPLGSWELTLEKQTYVLDITGSHPKYTSKVSRSGGDGKELKSSFTMKDGLILLQLAADTASDAGMYLLGGVQRADQMQGQGLSPAGANLNWVAALKSKHDPEKKELQAIEAVDRTTVAPVTFPNNGYGFRELPKAETVLLQHATVWTNTEQGILADADVLIQDGKIAQVGAGLKAPRGARTVDATGMHLTNGIIDEHTHIAIDRGVNEGTQASSAEVRIGDVVDPESIMLYRQLAGGVTAAQQLHGSANPIGGQSSIIKFRWGQGAEAMKLAAADGFIKFALGENVKQANWGEDYTSRYPQTRMGVEQFIQDRFQSALEYRKSWQTYEAAGGAASNLVLPRRDLEMECLLEILDKKRFITCHSYVQSEITMLIRLAERFGFTLNTFTHILEGYKVADKMAKHGAAGSTFADWWAYKYEVYEANPYNPTLMAEQGVVVAINSDDAEMARRLNQEAAKSVKYTGMSEEEAWKMVTLNPAKMLHLDDHLGTIEPNKDADIVLWNDNPLSVYARVQQTYVDGMLLYDQGRDLELRQQIQAERARLIQKLIAAKKGGDATAKPKPKRNREWHCNDTGDFMHNHVDITYEADQESATEAAQVIHRGDH